MELSGFDYWETGFLKTCTDPPLIDVLVVFTTQGLVGIGRKVGICFSIEAGETLIHSKNTSAWWLKSEPNFLKYRKI